MSNGKTIIGGLVVFVIVVTFPIWYGFRPAAEAAAPVLPLPENGSCIEERAYMKAHHMEILDDWRNSVVRDGVHEYTAKDGEVYTMSLTGTCLSCHADKDAFCTACHDFANVRPTCWDCHVESKGN